jgi:hypothetical protein
MMGTKDRSFAALPPVTLEDLIPPDSFYRHLERSLDLGFVRDLVRATYAETGRPSIDPVVFFKLHCNSSSSSKGCAPNVSSCRWSPIGSACAGISATI